MRPVSSTDNDSHAHDQSLSLDSDTGQRLASLQTPNVLVNGWQLLAGPFHLELVAT